jgi:hypothetical protein
MDAAERVWILLFLSEIESKFSDRPVRRQSLLVVTQTQQSPFFLVLVNDNMRCLTYNLWAVNTYSDLTVLDKIELTNLLAHLT